MSWWWSTNKPRRCWSSELTGAHGDTTSFWHTPATHYSFLSLGGGGCTCSFIGSTNQDKSPTQVQLSTPPRASRCLSEKKPMSPSKADGSPLSSQSQTVFLKSRQRCPLNPEVHFSHWLVPTHNNVLAFPAGALEWRQVIISVHPWMIPPLRRSASKQVMKVSPSSLCLSLWPLSKVITRRHRSPTVRLVLL